MNGARKMEVGQKKIRSVHSGLGGDEFANFYYLIDR